MLAAFLVIIGDIGVEGCQFVPIQHDDFLESMYNYNAKPPHNLTFMIYMYFLLGTIRNCTV